MNNLSSLSCILCLSTIIFYKWTVYISDQVKNMISLKQGLLSQPKYQINRYCENGHKEKNRLMLCQTKIFYFYKNQRIDVCSTFYRSKRFFKRKYLLLFFCQIELGRRFTIIKEKHLFKN